MYNLLQFVRVTYNKFKEKQKKGFLAVVEESSKLYLFMVK